MSLQRSLVVALFFVLLSPSVQAEATCPWGISYNTVLQDFSNNRRDVCRSEVATIRFVKRRAVYSCCVLDWKDCNRTKEIYQYYYNEIFRNPSWYITCYYNFFISYYSICRCPEKVRDIYPIRPTTRPPIRPPIRPPTRPPIRPPTRPPISPPTRPPPTIPTNDQSCGMTNYPSLRIVGGKKVWPCEFPWMAYFKAGNYMCGATIIDSRHVVTATHCVLLAGNNPMYISVGSNELGNGLNIGIKNSVTHPSYTTKSVGYYNDIAVLTLAEELTFNNCVQPICLPGGSHDFIRDPQNCYATGWGNNGSGILQNHLMKVRVPLLSPETCKRYIKGYWDGHLCAGYLEGGKDACVGDSGGPLMCKSKGQWVLTGVVSYGFKCAVPYRPGVYTNVKYYLNWILSNLHQ